MNLPNKLSLMRIAFVPVAAVVFLCGELSASFQNGIYVGSVFLQYSDLLVLLLFAAASITDFLDGYIARRNHLITSFGKFIDPIADKLLVTSALVVLLAKPGMLVTKLSFIPIIVILCRELLVSGLREFLMEVKIGMPVTRLAKWKTGFQMTALSMMLLKGFWYWGGIGEILLWVAGALTFITGYQYFQKSLDYIRAQDKVKKKSEPKETKAAAPKKKVKAPAKKSATPKKKVAKASAKK